jgi:hypothetical protein
LAGLLEKCQKTSRMVPAGIQRLIALKNEIELENGFPTIPEKPKLDVFSRT